VGTGGLFGTANDLKALLDAGLDPNSKTERGTTPLMMAAPDVDTVRLLVARGADVRLTESSGINLLHRATITNRATVIPVHVKAGVPLNATDDFWYTPLMYAATVDEGDTETLGAFLAAGAAGYIRNDQGAHRA
jgi:uncharacterized protein